MSMMSLVRRMDKEQKRKAGTVPGNQYYSLRVSPSCPPDKRVHVRGGRIFNGYNPNLATWDDWEYRAYTVPNLIAILDDPDSVTVEVTFTNANYYQLFLLELRLPAEFEEPTASDWSFNLHGTDEELATAGEAEMWLNSWDFQSSEPWEHYGGDFGCALPLCGLILKNDGQVGVAGAFLPVDVVNRGRSYTWPRDMRPRQFMRD